MKTHIRFNDISSQTMFIGVLLGGGVGCGIPPPIDGVLKVSFYYTGAYMIPTNKIVF